MERGLIKRLAQSLSESFDQLYSYRESRQSNTLCIGIIEVFPGKQPIEREDLVRNSKRFFTDLGFKVFKASLPMTRHKSYLLAQKPDETYIVDINQQNGAYFVVVNNASG